LQKRSRDAHKVLVTKSGGIISLGIQGYPEVYISDSPGLSNRDMRN
jgi:hypothetical protein